MNASKENARMAAGLLIKLLLATTSTKGDDARFIAEFMSAAERKLPTEAAYQRDRKRRKDKAA